MQGRQVGEALPECDNAIGWIKDRWKDSKTIHELARQMEVLGRNMATLRTAEDAESRKNARIVWQKAAQQYWELVWAIVEAKIDAGPPDELTFDPAERLFIDFGHLYSKYTTPNPYFMEQLASSSAVDMYQYNRLTDYIRENYALIFGKEYRGPEGGVTLSEKLARFEKELQVSTTRRRMAVSALFAKAELITKPELDNILRRLEDGLRDAVESDMRTKRVREAEPSEREKIREQAKHYETAERELLALIDSMERKLTENDEEEEETPVPEAPLQNAAETERPGKKAFDPFHDLGEPDDFDEGPENEVPATEESEEVASEKEPAPIHAAEEKHQQKDDGGTLDQSLKIIQNVLALHDRIKFLAGLIVHVNNEAERWKTRSEMAKSKRKGQGIPALKLDLREGLNHKKDFMMLAARTGRVDPSPLCQNRNMPISSQRAGEIMMDLTPLDPDMLRASRIRMYGIPRVILVPGQGLGVYDWEDNSLVIPVFPVTSDIKDFCFALAGFRWDNDEDRTLKDTYALLKANKGKGIRAMQESFNNDYFLWISKERKGYRVLPREVSKWFKVFFKSKGGMGNDMALKKPGAKK